jgi:peptide/nickel transport system ATP-binding protein
MSTFLLQVDQFSIGFHNQQGITLPVIRAVSFHVAAGEALGLVGESGCGKSTLGMALLGHLRSGSHVLAGRVLLNNADVFQLASAELEQLRSRHIAFVPQNAARALTPTMTIGPQASEALMLHHGMDQPAARQRVLELFERLRLPQAAALLQRFPHELSGGQQQRVMIAIALARRPALLVLDEPTTGLDAPTRVHVLTLLQSITRDLGTAMIYISHDLHVIAQVSARVAVMYAGEIVELAPVGQLFAQPAHPYTLGLLLSLPGLATADMPAAIAGRPPAPHEERPACTFAPRCSYVHNQCYELAPPPVTVPAEEGALHQVRCHYWQAVRHNGFARPPASAPLPQRQQAPAEPLLVLNDVMVRYPGKGWLRRLSRAAAPPATVADVSLVVQRGETLALVGESGSGKTTLLRAIAGLKRTAAGQIGFDSLDLRATVEQRPQAVHRAIQIIFQNPDSSLNPRHTIAESLDQPLRLYFDIDPATRRRRAEQLLDQVRLAPHYMRRFPGQLSGGEKQRVAIARAFAAEPELVLCDEVTSALDVSVQAAVLELLRELQARRRVAYLFITHNLAVVRALADRVAVLYHGRLCAISPVAALDAPPWHPYAETLLNATRPPNAARPRLLARDVPDPAPPPRGCPFQRRCPRHLGRLCDEEDPPWQTTSSGGRIRCHISASDLEQPQGLGSYPASAQPLLAPTPRA